MEVEPSTLYNQTTSDTSLILKGLLAAHGYNISVSAATEAGDGPIRSLQVETGKTMQNFYFK